MTIVGVVKKVGPEISMYQATEKVKNLKPNEVKPEGLGSRVSISFCGVLRCLLYIILYTELHTIGNI